MSSDPLQDAVDEQLRGCVLITENTKGTGGKGLTRAQIVDPRRRTETILINMADRIKRIEKSKNDKSKKRRRHRRRGPKVSTWHNNDLKMEYASQHKKVSGGGYNER